ncbi:hypothetical protein CORT_0B10210 [Candida orthopsilosis Co 90-125]|uniref:Uncharacterized protein n=1 Tax=Candida orthopsilosis (strain 90-125) TaxID=1136231 RepID=H8X204_CANO9|nr:hypothetical protein CORT_0B10210 [Candida orthopsilosis Co 90-125]CCG22725.1 hypothetical protein CORT_0B10210 [Candida orthopsilosis Co 90-125]
MPESPSYNIPGAFPLDSSTPFTNKRLMSVVNETVQHQMEAKFISNQLVTRKTKYQHEILYQLEALCYILIFYQLVKYCHYACLIPFLSHILVLLALNPRIITSSNSRTVLDILFEDADADTRRSTLERKLPDYSYMMYAKTLFVLLYHTLFITTWGVSLVNREKLSTIQYGTWWFISFIGENVPDISPDASTWSKIVELGLFQLLFVDLLILFIQLVLFQCIYYQSSLLGLSGRSINEAEVCVIRGSELNTGVQGDESLDGDQSGVFTALVVQLYENFEISGMFRWE